MKEDIITKNPSVQENESKLLACFAPIISQLKHARIEQRISQFDLECRIGITRGYLSKWECGLRTPSLFGLVCWASALGLEVEFIPSDPAHANDNGELISNDNLIRDEESELPNTNS